MSSHKRKEHLEKIKEAVDKTDQLSDGQKSSSYKLLELWYTEDLATDTLKEELLELSIFFEELFGELGFK